MILYFFKFMFIFSICLCFMFFVFIIFLFNLKHKRHDDVYIGPCFWFTVTDNLFQFLISLSVSNNFHFFLFAFEILCFWNWIKYMYVWLCDILPLLQYTLFWFKSWTDNLLQMRAKTLNLNFDYEFVLLWWIKINFTCQTSEIFIINENDNS